MIQKEGYKGREGERKEGRMIREGRKEGAYEGREGEKKEGRTDEEVEE
jgi:hypothetical protein